MNDHEQLRRVAHLYALGADRRSKEMWREVLADDVTIVGPGFEISGLEANLGSIDHLAHAFKATRHIVHDQDLVIQGDAATGETRGSAEHRLTGSDGSDQLLVWAIRYQDRWQRIDETWKFTRRELIVDWQEIRPVHDAGAASEGK